MTRKSISFILKIKEQLLLKNTNFYLFFMFSHMIFKFFDQNTHHLKSITYFKITKILKLHMQNPLTKHKTMYIHKNRTAYHSNKNNLISLKIILVFFSLLLEFDL